MTHSAKLYQLSALDIKSYAFAAIFVMGNILLPQLAHLIPQGGFIFLPIYFFTIVAAYKYGLTVGILTAVISPLANHLLFGMPALAVLPILLSKGMIAAVLASFAAKKFTKISIAALVGVVLGYQILGGLVEWAISGSLWVALQDFRMGIAGMALQIVGGFFVLKLIAKK